MKSLSRTPPRTAGKDGTHNNNNNREDPYTHSTHSIPDTHDTYTVCGDTSSRSDASTILSEGGRPRTGTGTGTGTVAGGEAGCGPGGGGGGLDGGMSSTFYSNYGHRKQVLHATPDYNQVRKRIIK